MVDNVQYTSLLPDSSLVTLGSGAISGTLFLSRFLVNLHSAEPQEVKLEWKCMTLSPCITFIPAIMTTLFMTPLGTDRSV